MPGSHNTVRVLETARDGEDPKVARIWYEALNELKRYGLRWNSILNENEIQFDPRGEYVKLDDVKAMLVRAVAEFVAEKERAPAIKFIPIPPSEVDLKFAEYKRTIEKAIMSAIPDRWKRRDDGEPKEKPDGD